MKLHVGAKQKFETCTPPGAFKRDIVPVNIRRAKSAIARLFKDLVPVKPSDYDLDKLYHRVVQAIERGESIAQSLTRQELRRIPWVLFYLPDGVHNSECIGCSHTILRQYENWIMGRPRSGPIHGLIYEFLRTYPRDIATFDGWRLLIERALQSHKSPSLNQWKVACSVHSLFGQGADVRFVENLIFSKQEVDPKLISAGFSGGLQTCTFLKNGLQEVLKRIGQESKVSPLSDDFQENLLQLLTIDKELRFSDRTMRVAVAHAFLDRYVDHEPPKDMMVRLRDWFMQYFGNPHLPRHRRLGWVGVPDEHRLVVGKWLVELYIDAFVDLIKETAKDSHWRFREAFWRSLSRRGLIREIWFALGPDARRHLRTHARIQNTQISAAELRGAAQSQSVLLMHVAGMTIAEWSHNGCCRIWLQGNAHAPKLFERSYRATDLRIGPEFCMAHNGSESYRWQAQTANWLRDHGVPDIRQEDYLLTRVQQGWSTE